MKCVIFDIDDTMYAYTKYNEIGMERLEAYVTEHFSVSAGEFRKSYERMREETEERLGVNNAAAHSRHIWIQNLLETWDAPLFPHISEMYKSYWGTVLEVCRPEPGLLDCLTWLKERGIRIGVGSDMTTMMQYEKLKRLGAAPFIDFIVTSQEAGVEKPHADFMKRCLFKARASASQCLFIGDNFVKDVGGAVSCGMYGVWYNPAKKRQPDGCRIKNGDYSEIRHFRELPDIVLSLARD